VGRIYAIAINTFREAVRDKVLYGALGFGCAVLFFTLAVAELSLNQQARVIEDVGLASISLFSVLVAVFLGSSLLYKEIERKTLYVILPKPISRMEFLLGKYLGIVMTVLVFVGLMGALLLWLSSLQAGVGAGISFSVLLGLALLFAVSLWKARDRTAVLVPFALIALSASAWLLSRSEARVEPVLAQLALSMVEVLVITAVALLFSSFSTPFLTGAFTLGVWLTGRAADDMALMKPRQVGETLARMLHVLAEVVPNLQLFVPSRAVLAGEGHTPIWVYVAQSSAYGGLYVAILLVFAVLIFRQRDFI
jgi:Cu-processing system permease protein